MKIGNISVHRIFIDNGSVVDILFYNTFRKMGLKDSDLKPVVTPLYEFTSESIILKEMVAFPIIVGEFPTNATVMAHLLVVDCLTTFNVIIG